MESLWNDTNFSCPPVNTYKCLNKRIVSDFANVSTTVSDAIFFLENQQVFHKEAAILSRLMYLMGRKFRHDIGHSYLRRTNTALLKYLNLNFLRDLKIFSQILPSGPDSMYLPTRQMLEYILIRLQTFGTLMCRIVVCARKAATFYFERLKRGDSAWLSLMPYTVLSRIWLLTDRILKNSCKWFNSLLPFRNFVNIIGIPLTSPDYTFPNDLFNWLGIERLDKQLQFLWKSGAHHLSTHCIGSSVNNEIDSNSETSDVVEECRDDLSVEQLIVPAIQISNHLGYKKSEDYGEKISRKNFLNHTKHNISTNSELKVNRKTSSENFVTPALDYKENESKIFSILNASEPERQLTHNLSGKSRKGITTEHKHMIESVTCTKSLVKFLNKEDGYRLKNDKRSLTSHVSFMQWESLKKLLTKKIFKLEKKEKLTAKNINKHVKEMWMERCS